MKLLSYQIDRSSPVEVGLINALGVVSLHRGLPAAEAVETLLSRDPKPEMQ